MLRSIIEAKRRASPQLSAHNYIVCKTAKSVKFCHEGGDSIEQDTLFLSQ